MNYQKTSAEAYAEFQNYSGTLDEQILAVLEKGPATCDAIELLINRSHQAVSGNLRHLVENGYVEASGAKGQTRTGRKAIIWRLTT